MDNLTKHLAMKVRAFIDVLFPRVCVCCKAINPKGRFKLLCPDCAKSISFCTGGKCLICGEILGTPDMPNVRGCPKCAELKIAYESALCSTVYSGAIRQIIHAFKYNNATYIATDIVKIALQNPATKDFLQNATIVPVPMHPLKKIKRGYNQTEVLAKTLQKFAPELNIKIAPLLKRVQFKTTQTHLSREERIENIKGVFAKTKFVDNVNKLEKIVILDDVMTTTATTNECARTLKKAGFKNIRIFTFAKRM